MTKLSQIYSLDKTKKAKNEITQNKKTHGIRFASNSLICIASFAETIPFIYLAAWPNASDSKNIKRLDAKLLMSHECHFEIKHQKKTKNYSNL